MSTTGTITLEKHTYELKDANGFVIDTVNEEGKPEVLSVNGKVFKFNGFYLFAYMNGISNKWEIYNLHGILVYVGYITLSETLEKLTSFV